MSRRFVVDVLAPDYSYKIGSFAPENLLSVSASWMWWVVSTSSLLVNEEGPEAAQLLRCRDIPVPITMKAPGLPRWDGYAVYASLDKKTGTRGRITATMVSNRKWIDRLLAAPVPGSSWASQSGAEYDVRIGHLETVVRQYITANIARVAASGVALPVRVTPAPVVDTSPVITISARNQSIRDELESTIEANGYDVQGYLWLPGDRQPPGLTLTVPSVVIDVVKGREKAYINFTETYGGIASRQVTVKAPDATAVIVGGPGEGTARVFNYVRSTTPTPPMTQAANAIRDRLALVVPAKTRAAVFIRDRIDGGGSFFEDWTWEYAPRIVGVYNDQILNEYGGNPLDVQASVIWLTNYINTHGGEPTLPTPAMTATAQTILDRFRSVGLNEPGQAAQLILDRFLSQQQIFEDWTWTDDMPTIVGQWNDYLRNEFNTPSNDPNLAIFWLRWYLENRAYSSTLYANWAYPGASADVELYGPQLVRLYGDDPFHVQRSKRWLESYVDNHSGQEFFEDWTWYDAPLIVGMYNDKLLNLYGGNSLDKTAALAWLTTYIAATDTSGSELPPAMYAETFFEVTSEASSQVRIDKGKERLAELAGQVGMLIQIDDGRPWKAGPENDYWVGDYVRASFNEISTADYITRVTATSNTEGFVISAQLGDPNLVESSDIKLAKIVQQLSQEIASIRARK